MKLSQSSKDAEITDDTSDDAMRDFIGYGLKRAYLVVHKAATDVLQSHGLKVRSFSALCLIMANPGITPSRLAELLDIERSNLVVIVDDLEQNELINRTRDLHDRRRYALTATLRGRRLQQKVSAEVNASEARAMSQLTPAELDTLAGLLHRIGRNANR